MVCVGPQATMPPSVQAPKYVPENSSIFLCALRSAFPRVLAIFTVRICVLSSNPYQAPVAYDVACSVSLELLWNVQTPGVSRKKQRECKIQVAEPDTKDRSRLEGIYSVLIAWDAVPIA